LNSKDLAVCDRVLAEIKREFALSDDSEEVQRSAAIIIELFRQGVHDEVHLKALVFAARGKFDGR
jgi:hypothetical protein